MEGSSSLIAADWARPVAPMGAFRYSMRTACFLNQWTPPGGGPFAPMAVDVDADGRVYVGDAANRTIWIIESQSGEVLETVEGVSVHGMSVSSSGDDIYVSGRSGVGRYTRKPAP